MANSDLAERFGRMVFRPVGPRQQERRGRSVAPQQRRRRHHSAGHTPVQRAPSVRRQPADPYPLQRAPSRHRQPSPPRPQHAQIVRRQPADPRPVQPVHPNSRPAVFFNEGRGYLFVKLLGNGVDGSASLVRSVMNGKLYVRKEEFHWEHLPRDIARFAITVPEEAANAAIVRYVPGTYQAHGWTRWVNPQGGMSFNVTYWEHHDLGSLKGFVEASRKMGRSVPESWGALWFVYMVHTMVRVQIAGLVHNDPHHGNWLLASSTTGTGIPHITLGDFGRAQRKTEVSHYKLKDQATDDFELILMTITSALGLIHNRKDQAVYRPKGNSVSSHLVARFSDFARISSKKWDSVKELHRAVLDASGEIFKMYENSAAVTHPAAVPRRVDYPFMTGDGLVPTMRAKPQAFKQWRHANVLGNEITTRSTGWVERLQQHVGDWHENMGQGPPAWHVDHAPRY